MNVCVTMSYHFVANGITKHLNWLYQVAINLNTLRDKFQTIDNMLCLNVIMLDVSLLDDRFDETYYLNLNFHFVLWFGVLLHLKLTPKVRYSIVVWHLLTNSTIPYDNTFYCLHFDVIKIRDLFTFFSIIGFSFF